LAERMRPANVEDLSGSSIYWVAEAVARS
jgi:hypothetical protein